MERSKKWRKAPIFNPYIFLFINEAERGWLFQTVNVFRFLCSAGKLATVTEEETGQIKFLCNHAGKVSVEPRSLKEGDKVKITAGPLTELGGYAMQENGRKRFVVKIRCLGQFAKVEIDSCWLTVNGQILSCFFVFCWVVL